MKGDRMNYRISVLLFLVLVIVVETAMLVSVERQYAQLSEAWNLMRQAALNFKGAADDCLRRQKPVDAT